MSKRKQQTAFWCLTVNISTLLTDSESKQIQYRSVQFETLRLFVCFCRAQGLLVLFRALFSAETWGLQCCVEQNVKISPGQLHFFLRGHVLSPWAALHLPQLTLTPRITAWLLRRVALNSISWLEAAAAAAARLRFIQLRLIKDGPRLG